MNQPISGIDPDWEDEAEPEMDNPRETMDNLGTMVGFHSQYFIGDAHSFASPDDFSRKINDTNAVILPLYAYIHGGITIATHTHF